MKIVGPRLKEARIAAGFRSQGSLGDRVGLKQQTISDIENDIPETSPKVYEIAKACGVSVEWLTGRADGQSLKSKRAWDLRTDAERDRDNALSWQNVPKAHNLSYAESSIAPPSPQDIEKKLKESENNLNEFRDFLQKNEASAKINEIDIRAGASPSGGKDDTDWNDEHGNAAHEPIASWAMPSSFVERELGLKPQFADIIRIRGDSMDDGSSKGFSSGDRVIIDRQDVDPRQGGIFAVFDGDGVIIKQVELLRGHEPPSIVCKSLNARYDPVTLALDGTVRIIGRVAGKISRC